MYNIINNTTGESEAMTEREAVAKYGNDKVNAMLFGMDPDMSLVDTDGDIDMPCPDNVMESDFM